MQGAPCKSVWKSLGSGAAQATSFDEGVLDKIFTQLDQTHSPGAAVGLAIRGVPVYRKGFGLASVELPLSLSTTTRMRIGSVTKHFTSLAFLLLCEQDKADLDEPLSKYFPELKAWSDVPTMRQLLGHVSGIRDACDWFFYDGLKRVSAAEVLAFYAELDEVNSRPGMTWCYNDGAYVLLGMAIERIANEPLESFLRRRIFQPVGMLDTIFCKWDTDCYHNSASLHIRKSTGAFERGLRFIEGAGQGGIVSTVDDMLRWLGHMTAPQVGTPATWELLTSSQKLDNGTLTGYGLGLIVGDYRGARTLGHMGLVMGGDCLLLKVPDAGLDLVVITNRNDFSGIELGHRILDACLPELEPPQAQTKCLNGIFQSSKTGRLIRVDANRQQRMVWINGTKIPFEWTRDGLLCSGPEWRFRRYAISLATDGDHVRSIGFREDDCWDELLPATPPGQNEIGLIAGRYRSDSTGFHGKIVDDPQGALLILAGGFGSPVHRLDAFAPRVWSASSTGSIPQSGLLSFDASLRGFELSTLTNQKIMFRRL